jgi:hypothetical protein
MRKSALRWLITLTTTAAATVHIGQGVSAVTTGDARLGLLFMLAAAGFFGLLFALFLVELRRPEWRTMPHGLLMAFSVIIFIVYFVINGFSLSLAGIIALLAELVLIAGLFLHLRAPA